MTEAMMPVTVEQCAQPVAWLYERQSDFDGNKPFDERRWVEDVNRFKPDDSVHWIRNVRPLFLNTRATPPSPAGLAGEPIDSGMDAASVERAEWLWTNLPTGPRKWTSLATYEKALVCHTVARLTANGSQPDRVVDVLRDRVKDILRGEPGDEYTDRGMEDAFFRWPVIEHAIDAALATLDAKDQSNG